MSLLDLLRQEYVKGKVIDKYRLPDGNIGLIIDQDGTHNRYHVQFRDDYRARPCVENLFGLLKDPFSGKTEYVDRLVNKGDYIELSASYSKGPFREAYRLHSVQSASNKDLRRRAQRMTLPLYRPAPNYARRPGY